jgi:hypothetical protein
MFCLHFDARRIVRFVVVLQCNHGANNKTLFLLIKPRGCFVDGIGQVH